MKRTWWLETIHSQGTPQVDPEVQKRLQNTIPGSFIIRYGSTMVKIRKKKKSNKATKQQSKNKSKTPKEMLKMKLNFLKIGIVYFGSCDRSTCLFKFSCFKIRLQK